MCTRTVGTCSLCGGPVTIPLTWLGVVPPTPTCSRCGAVAQQYYGPVIPMKRPPTYEPLPHTGYPPVTELRDPTINFP